MRRISWPVEMESDIVMFGFIFVVCLVLLCACSFLCTQGHKLLKKLSYRRPSRVPHPRRRTASSSAALTFSSEVAPCILSEGESRSNVPQVFLPFETQRSSPPPLPPRPQTLQGTTISIRNPTQLLADPQINENLQYPPRSLALALQLRNMQQVLAEGHRGNPIGSPRSPLSNHRMSTSAIPSTHRNDGPILVSQSRYYRQSVAAFANYGERFTAFWLNNEHERPNEDLPPTYEEAMGLQGRQHYSSRH